MNPAVNLLLEDERRIEVYIGGKDSSKIKYAPPVDESGNAVLPHTCRLENKTYALTVIVDIEVVYTIGNEKTTQIFNDVVLGKIPLMLKSSLCYLSNMTSEQLYDAGECKFELGGYFVIEGSEKVLLTQERLGDNLFYASRRRPIPEGSEAGLTVVEKAKASELQGASKGEDYEYVSGLRSISEDGTKGPFSHFLLIPPKNAKPDDPNLIAKTPDYGDFSTKRLVTITLPGFTQPVPLVSVFYALGVTNDQDLYDTILAGVPQKEKTLYDEIFAQMILSHEKFLRQEMAKEQEQNEDPNMLVLRRQTRTKSKAGVYMSLFNELFPHCELGEGETAGSFYRRKSYLLGHMTRMAMEVAIGIRPKSDRDHFRFKRVDASGELCFQEFRRVYRDLSKSMKTQLDSKIHFNQQIFEGKKLTTLVQVENLKKLWPNYTLLSEFEKSFKGKWGGKDGISQELARLSYVGSIAHLRRVNLQMDKGTKQVEPRRIHSSTWGIMCPTDNPDGHNIGMIKSMTLLCAISTAFPSKNVIDIIKTHPAFTPISIINPSTWDVRWTKVFVNSDLIGVIEKDTESLHDKLLTSRRKGDIDKFVSLCWSRIDNEYIISTDAGRPCRPVYREGVKADQVSRTKSWDNMVRNLFDYIDPQETESVRISMEPYCPDKLSEIHGMAIMSASASIVPFSDHNQGTRPTFACQQAKQACSWYNTAFNKRFDTMATWLNYAQRPLCQTSTLNNVLGKDGCMPYGQNVIVALMVYTGHNQEDSVIFNDSAVRRGLFGISYYHSYDVVEDMVDENLKIHTEFANVGMDPRYRETVVKKEGYDYSKLDGDGVIQKGQEVDDKTILVGIVAPLISGGQVVGYNDISYETKRGQRGFVDDVYRYTNSAGLRCVKIRIAESREPVIGDKMANRSGNKGTCGMRIPEEDMPFTSTGIRPDLIFNPHGIPSRMTTGYLLEMIYGKLGTHLGAMIDASPFTSTNRMNETRDLLYKAGFHPAGHEVLYNGMDGQMMGVELFFGPSYYIRLKQMVEDKINYVNKAPRKLLTRQPVEGRAAGGGLRIGEMERDSLISHGISKFLNESLMERSDKTEVLYQEDLGKFDANPNYPYTKMEIPYAVRLLLNEIESMHISTHLTSSS